jgi:hypothetical protein
VEAPLPLSLMGFSSFNISWPELEELHLRFYSARTQDTLSTAVDHFHNAPKLRRITINNLPIAEIKLPWAQLTKFSSHHEQDIMALCTLLQLAPNLLEVDWQLAYNSSAQIDVVVPKVQHMFLRDLSISIAREYAGHSFDHISLTSLRTLSIDAAASFFSSPQFASFVAQNCDSLENIELCSVDITGSQLVACMKALQSISHFAFSNCDLRGLFMDSVTRHNAESVETLLQALSYTTRKDLVVLPRLRSITVQCAIDNIIPEKCSIGSKFADMVESRWRVPALSYGRDLSSQSDVMVSRIDTASLKLISSPTVRMDPRDLDRLQTLRDEGLIVQVISHRL